MEFIKGGYAFWLRHYAHKDLDKRVASYLGDGCEKFEIGKTWLKDAREALFLSTGRVSQALRVSRAAYAKLEKNEKNGAISLLSLAKAAEAMDCELVYAIRPKKCILFSEVVWRALLEDALVHPWVTNKPQKLKFRALAAIAKITMLDSKFRKLQGWSKRVSFTD